jgi:hypothetical protein
LTQPALGFPTAGLDDLRAFFQAQLQGSTDFGGLAIGPGAFDQRLAGMGGTGLGHRPVPASLGTGVFRGDQAQEFHECSWRIKACQVAHVGHHGNGHGQLDAAPGLARLNHRGQASRFALGLACLCETLESFGMLLNGTDIFLQDDVLSRCGADDFRQPPEGGRAPMGPAHVTDSLSQQKGFETERGVFEIAAGICTRPGESPDGFIFHRGDRDHGESPRAGEPGQWQGVSAVGCDPIAWFGGDQSGCHDPAVVAFFRQRAGEPGATGTGFVDEEQMLGLRWHCADEWIEVTLAGAKSSERGDLSTMILGDRGDSNRVFVDIHADKECARRGPG